jgi:hypothetical protein
MEDVKIRKRRCLINEFLAAGPRLITHMTSRLPYVEQRKIDFQIRMLNVGAECAMVLRFKAYRRTMYAG